jgi:hypothetical protein
LQFGKLPYKHPLIISDPKSTDYRVRSILNAPFCPPIRVYSILLSLCPKRSEELNGLFQPWVYSILA